MEGPSEVPLEQRRAVPGRQGASEVAAAVAG